MEKEELKQKLRKQGFRDIVKYSKSGKLENYQLELAIDKVWNEEVRNPSNQKLKDNIKDQKLCIWILLIIATLFAIISELTRSNISLFLAILYGIGSFSIALSIKINKLILEIRRKY